MSIISKMKYSRTNWKNKAVTRGQEAKYLRKENKRIKQERDQLKKILKGTKGQLKGLQNIPQIRTKENIIYISLQLFLVAKIGFRAVTRVLEILGHNIGLTKTPCTQTIINWVTRLSLARIDNTPPLIKTALNGTLGNGKIWILDASIGLGAGKILAVLALDAKHHFYEEGAPTLQKVSCVAVSVAASWTGETIANFLQKIIAVTGKPAAYLKDGGTDLAKAVRLLGERNFPGHTIDDISHAIANLLKHEYKNHPMFDTFLSSCGKASKKLKQTILACLAPPKVSTKARFMNLHHLVNWADNILKHSPKGRAAKGSILAKLRSGLNEIPNCKAFISRFLRDANHLLECQKILKNEGMSQKSLEKCLIAIEPIPAKSPVRRGFTTWAEEQLQVAEALDLERIGMPISSDTIESLFGVAKQHGTGTTKDANRIALRLPALCGELTREDAKMVTKFSVSEQQKVEDQLPSLTKQRRKILANPGCIENLKQEDLKQNLELIPRPKKRSKKQKSTATTECCAKPKGPPFSLSSQRGSVQKNEVDRWPTAKTSSYLPSISGEACNVYPQVTI